MVLLKRNKNQIPSYLISSILVDDNGGKSATSHLSVEEKAHTMKRLMCRVDK